MLLFRSVNVSQDETMHIPV